MSWPIIAAAAVLGLMKSQLVDKPKEKSDRRIASATTRYSPWTNMTAGPIREADPLGTALSYGITGGALSNAMASPAAAGAAPTSAGIYGPTTTPLVQPTLGGGRAAAAGAGPSLMSSSPMVMPAPQANLASFPTQAPSAAPPRYSGMHKSYEAQRADNAWEALLRAQGAR
jgi:hypothetical protein